MPKTKKTETDIQPNDNELQTKPPTTAENIEAVSAAPAQEAAKPKRTSRKKKDQTEQPNDSENAAVEKTAKDADNIPAQMVDTSNKSNSASVSQKRSVLTIDAYADIQTQQDVDDAVWHEIQNAYFTKKILTGTLGGVEKMENGADVAVVHYKGFRIAIPLKEMSVSRDSDQRHFDEYLTRQRIFLSKILGAEIDFIIRGIDSASRSIVASRKDAMLKKRQTFYMEQDANGLHQIHPGRVVQARIIGVAEKTIRVEIFGVESSIYARDLNWQWIGDARERYAIGDTILLQIISVTLNGIDDIRVTADVKSLNPNLGNENLSKCRVQGKYAGKVTDVKKGVIYVHLSNGVNAIAHSCYDHRMPGKKDDVIFVVTRLDREHSVAIGIITRIIRQNL